MSLAPCNMKQSDTSIPSNKSDGSPFLRRSHKRRQIDFEIIIDWIKPEARVLDLGCGRGVLLRELQIQKNAYTIGVDADPSKIASCLRRKVNAYQGDLNDFMKAFDRHAFDYIIFSRTLELIHRPGEVLRKACEISNEVIVGIINRGYWKNRLHVFLHGQTIRNDVYPLEWGESPLSNHVSIDQFLHFCTANHLKINRSVYLRGDWDQPCQRFASWRAGYALFSISRKK